MLQIDHKRAAEIQQITALAQALQDALEDQNTEQILIAQQNLTATAEMIWARVDNDTAITGREKGFLRALAGAAIKELPEKIKDPANYPKIKHELRLLKSSAAMLL